MNFTISKNDAVAICTTSGAELISFEKDETEYCWYGIPEHWSGRAPVLFPVLCSPKDGVIIADGKKYDMPKHGLARKCEFVPVEVTPSKVVFELTENAELMSHYPYKFCLRISHEIFDNGFETTYRVINTDDKKITFCIGGHPGFNCPIFENEKFEDYSLYFEDYNGAVMSVTQENTGYMCPEIPKLDIVKNNELPLNYKDFDNDALIIEGLKNRSVKLVNRNTGHGFKFDFERFDALGIWTPVKMNSPFLCLEPWCGLPASTAETPELENKKYAKILNVGEFFETSYKFTVI